MTSAEVVDLGRQACEGLEPAQNMRIVVESGPHEPGLLYVALVDDQRVGHLFVSSALRGRLDSDVRIDMRRRGIATALYLRALADLGALEARLWEQSTDAYELWQSLERRGCRVERSGSFATLRPPAS